MKRTHRYLLAVATTVVVSTTTPPLAASAHGSDRGHGGQRAELQRALDELVAAGAIGAVAEVRDERGVWRGSSGVSALGRGRPEPGSLTRIGSVTKSFLATVVLQLVATGDLRLDDPVETWLPGMVPNGDEITLRHLLSHTSGIADVVPTLPLNPPSEYLKVRWRTWTATELIARATALPPTHPEPGRVYKYSNTGYLLLGLVVEKATGTSSAEQVRRRIIRPLTLRNTSLPGTFPFLIGPHLHGYLPVSENGQPARPVDITARNPSIMGAAGEMVSTTADLNRFYAALLGGELLEPAELAEMTGATPTSGYGFGIRRRTFPGCDRSALGNDGDALGYLTYSFATDDNRRRVTVSYTPWGPKEPEAQVDVLLSKALCR